jgi:hypothetical protein
MDAKAEIQAPVPHSGATALDLYLDLLKRSLTDTLREPEPNHDSPDRRSLFVAFTHHYINGPAITMLPLARIDNIRYCIEQVVRDGIPGDVIETGVWRGGACIYMRGCLKAMGVTDRIVWVADSFEGLPDPAPEREKETKFHNSPSMQKSLRKLEAGLEEVQANFAAYELLDENVRFLKGWFKDTLPDAPIERLAVIRLDGDYYQSTMDALTALYDRLSPGGFVIVDDYGEDLWTDCRQAIEDFRTANAITDPLLRVDATCVYWRRSS